ncbi:NAC domain-containing protein 71-like [Fagus crenata]
MGDPNDPRATTSFSLPPGCRFFPSQQELLSYYLTNKNLNPNPNPESDGILNGYDLIRELDLYEYDPFELPDDSRFSYGNGGRKKHHYCYTNSSRVKKESRGKRRTRKTKNGYWKRSGNARDVVGPGGKVPLGSRTTFVFYLRNSPNTARRTEWFMYEYALVDHLKASFVVCRVFAKSRAGNSISDNGLSSCAEEGVSAVRHIGIQHDEYFTSDTVEAKLHDDNSVDRNSEIPRYPMQLVGELDDPAMTRPISVASLPFRSGMQPMEPVISSGLPESVAMFVEGLTDQELLSIIEEDFIELDDLIH